MPLYGRQVALEIGVAGEDFRRWEGLRVAARVKKTPKSSPNAAEIEVYNLSADSIAEAQRDGAIVRLFAGYDVHRLIFAGSINRDGATLKKQGPDRVLSIEAKDGGREYTRKRVNRTYDKGTKISKIVEDLAADTALPQAVIEVDEDAQLTQGVTLTGRISDALDRLAESTAGEWSIQDGELQFLPRGGYTSDQAILVSSAPGSRNLIGSPAPGKDGLEVTALLDGRYLPGRRIRLEAADYQGIYRVRSLEHSLDSGWDQAYYSEMVCKEVG